MWAPVRLVYGWNASSYSHLSLLLYAGYTNIQKIRQKHNARTKIDGIFIACQNSIAIYGAILIRQFRPSVRPSITRWYIVLKWLNRSSRNQHCTVAYSFWTTVCKTVRPMLSDRCLSVLSVLSVCDVGVNQDETWHAGRPRPWPHCVRWGPSCPSPKGAQPPILAHISCDQMAGWIKMPLGTKVGLDPGHILLHGDPAPPKRGTAPPPIFGPCLLWPNGRPS